MHSSATTHQLQCDQTLLLREGCGLQDYLKPRFFVLGFVLQPWLKIMQQICEPKSRMESLGLS